MMYCLNQAKRLIKEYVDSELIPCVAAGVTTLHDDGSIYMGNSSLLPEKVPLRNDAIFDLASVSKVVGTTTMTLQCIEKGFFSLKTKVSSIFSDFPYEDITIEHLLTHTSGICHDDKEYKKLKGKEGIRDLIFNKKLEYKPGTKVLYSDLGFVLLGFIIEHYVGNLDTYFDKNIAIPLRMHDTAYNPKDKCKLERCVPTEITQQRGVIKGVVHDGKSYLLGGISGNAGLFSTLEDLTNFTRMMLNNGSFEEKKILSKASIKLLKKCYTSNLNERRTLGWAFDEKNMSFGDYYSDCCLYHTGFTGTSVYIDFKRNCSIILLTNRIHPTRDNNVIIEFRNQLHNVILSEFDNFEE